MQKVMLAEASGTPIDTHDLSHLDLWQKAVASNPHKVALISRDQPPSTFRWLGSSDHHLGYAQWTFADLDRGARRLATTLQRLTPLNGRPIATLINSQAEWALFFWAAAYLHVPLMPINPKTASRSDEISHMLRLTRPRVIVTASPDIGAQLEQSVDTKMLDDIPVKICLSRGDEPLSYGWNLFSNVMSGDLSPPDTPLPSDSGVHSLILFTSGTTSLPKPCAHTSAQTANGALAYITARQITHEHRLVHHLPGFHAYGITWGLVFWLAGGSVVYPSAAFESQASLDCIDRFKCTHTSLVPSTAQAILAHPALPTTDISSLVSIDVSGAGVLPSVVESCEKALKIPAYTSYGMTESPGTIIWPAEGGSVLRNGDVFSGFPSRGVTARICEPETRKVMLVGQPGELHCTGVQVISGYLDPDVSSKAFYEDDEGRPWVITGDQAVMSEDGAITIVGRYKDLIIRGGENISPASIEDFLGRYEGVELAQVVAAPDEMAGEVPIAVIKTLDGFKTSAHELKQGTTLALGPAFAPKTILNLKTDLGLDAWPSTASGKVRKVEVAQIVRKFLAENQGPAVNKDAPTVESLISIWTKISGHDGLLPETVIQSFADSLMMMQLSGIVKAELSKDITVEDFKACERIQDQADLIDSRAERTAASARPQRQGPPTLKDMTHAQGNEEIFLQTKKQVTAALADLDLEWSDVEDVMPLPDWEAIMSNVTRPQSWTLRMSFHAPVDYDTLVKAVKESLPYHPTLRSMAFKQREGAPLLVSIRPSEKWDDLSITTGWEVETKEDLNTLLLNHPVLDCASLPGPMFRVHIAKVRSDGTSGLVIVGSHSVLDASMTKLWLDDMVISMTGEGTMMPHSLFNDYAAAYFTHRMGAEAERGIQYWTQKLQGVGLLPESTYWPQKRAPEWFKGCDYGWKLWDGTKVRESLRSVPLSDKEKAQKGIRAMVRVENIANLKSKHDVPVFMLVKAAIALLNIKRTQAKEAVFGTMNAARKWPFSSDYSAAEKEYHSDNPLDISGCTVEYTLDRIAVDLNTSVLAFMQEVSRGEDVNSEYAHTPFLRLVERMKQPLSKDDTRTEEERKIDADSLISLVRRQSFNWLPMSPSAQQDPRGMKMLEMLTRMDNGLTITGFLADDKHSVALSLTWDAEHLTMAEAKTSLEDLVALVDAMGKESNWSKSAGDIL